MTEPGPIRAVLLAGGAGRRLGELSEHTPKAMVRLQGEPIIARTLRWLAAHGIVDVTIVAHHFAEQVREAVGDGQAFGVAVRFVEEATPRGTAGALASLRESLSGGAFLLVAGDTDYDFDLGALLAAHATNAAAATLALYSLDVHEHTGGDVSRIEVDRAGRVLRFVAGETDPQLRMASAACHVFESGVLDLIPHWDTASGIAGELQDFGLRELFAAILSVQGIVCAHTIDGRALGFDTPEQLSSLRRLVGTCSSEETAS